MITAITDMHGQFDWFWSVILPFVIFGISVVASFWLYLHFTRK